MTPLRQQMIAALQLSGKGERTQQAYVREVRLLAQFYHKSPDRISAQELQAYFLHRKNVDGLAPASMRIRYSGIRFFYQHVLKRDWSTLALIRAQTAHRLPAVRSIEEVRRLLQTATPLHNHVYFTTVYSLGRRLHEALFLQVSDIDGQCLQVHAAMPSRRRIRPRRGLWRKVEAMGGAVQRLPVPRSSEYPACRRDHWAMGRPSVR
jgi:integrase/recombinase XerD